MTKKHIVIVGGGAGGLELATRLGNKLGKKNKATITLVDANPTHLWKPRLHEVAAGVLNSNVDELNYAAHGYQHGFKFVLGRLIGLDRKAKKIQIDRYTDGDLTVLPEREFNYDQLVIAVGSQTNDFNTLGAKQHCIFLDQRQSAERFRQSLLNSYWRSNIGDQDSLSIAIIGAGATGVELAAELNHIAHELYRYGFRGISPDQVTITIVEAGNRVMPALTEKSSGAIHRQLQKLNIKVATGELVTEVTADSVITKSGQVIPADLKVWSAGVKAPEFLAHLDGLEVNRINQIVVNEYLQSSIDSDVFAFGDCAQFIPPGSDSPVPPRAQVASQQATVLAKSLIQMVNGKPLVQFIFKDKGSLISLSKHSSVGQIMGNLSGDFTFEGKLARLFYVTLYRLHQFAIHGYWKTALLIIRDVINRRTGPTMKLH